MGYKVNVKVTAILSIATNGFTWFTPFPVRKTSCTDLTIMLTAGMNGNRKWCRYRVYN